jgi:hypothetical protein
MTKHSMQYGFGSRALPRSHSSLESFFDRSRNLPRVVCWLIGNGLGYDIKSFDPLTGEDIHIEVKTTVGPPETPFTGNQLRKKLYY